MSVVRSTLETERLRLIPTEPAHADPMWDSIEPSLPELKPWLAWAAYASLSETRNFTERSEREWTAGSSWDFTIVLDDVVAGNIGLTRYVPLWRSCHMGYWLRSDLAGRGLMTEAASAVVEFGFARAAVHRIELHAAPANIASWKVAEKLGFRREGTMRDACWAEPGFMDMYVYGLLSTDPRPNPNLPPSAE